MTEIATFLTFESRGREAIELYCSIFEDSAVDTLYVLPGSDQLLHGSFTLAGRRYLAMDGGPSFSFSTGTSIMVTCEDQAEVDRYWDALTADGGEPGRCGWCKDPFGLSWQIIPSALGQLMGSADPARAERVRAAMLAMDKIDVAGLQAAYDGV